jgi:cell division protein FtsQ
MDGGGRFLRSIGRPGGRGLSRLHPSRWPIPHPALGWALGALVIATFGALGAVRGGQYDAFAAAHGTPFDIAARMVGFGIRGVSIAGIKELTESQVLDLAGIKPVHSLAFLDVEDVRARLMRSPFVQDAGVRKLFPDRLEIKIVEREPFAFWQRDGKIDLVARDGTVLDPAQPERFIDLPFVVGDEANLHVEAYAALVASMGDLAGKVKSGAWIAGRRWNFRMESGIDVKLPSENPQSALRTLADLQRTARILDKDLTFIDLREPGRVAARLTPEAAEARDAQRRPATRGGAA